jgi:hypothetical protein
LAYELWGEMCGRKQSLSRAAIAIEKPDSSRHQMSSLVTEAIAAISAGDNKKKDRDR